MFVASDMTMALQAADLAIYCINWGFRLPAFGMSAPTRPEIADEFGPWLNELQYRGKARRGGRTYDLYGIAYVPNPYGDGRVEKEKEIKLARPPRAKPSSDSISVSDDSTVPSLRADDGSWWHDRGSEDDSGKTEII